jgi:hypothetical protein
LNTRGGLIGDIHPPPATPEVATAQMVSGLSRMALVVVMGSTLIGSVLTAESVLAELGLTEATAREFVLSEVKRPTSERAAPIVITGTRAFLKLPAAARGPAAAALFAWAKAYVDSAAFKTAYAGMRRTRLPPPVPTYDLTVEQAVKKQIDDYLAGLERLKLTAAPLSPAEREQLLKSVKEQEALWRDPAMARELREAMEAERAREHAQASETVKKLELTFPADPNRLLALRLRQFLEETADANFSARTISLTGGADGIEFVDPADRKRSWLWQSAVIAGKQATTAARAAAVAWLQEIEQ